MAKFEVSVSYSDDSEIELKAYRQGVSCDIKVVNDTVAMKRASLELIANDISSCLEYLNLIEGVEAPALTTPLYKAFVITYGKCFSQGKERGLSLDARKIYKESDSEFLMHKSIMDTRNKYVAHSDSSAHESGEMYLATHAEYSEVYVLVGKYSSPIEASLEREKELCFTLLQTVKEMIKKMDGRIINQFSDS